MQTPTHTRTKNTPTFRRTAPTPVRTPSRGSNAVDLKKYNSFGWGLGVACFLGVVIINPMFFFAMLLGAGVAATVAWMAYSRFANDATQNFQHTLDQIWLRMTSGLGQNAETEPYDPTLCFDRPPNVRVLPPVTPRPEGPGFVSRIITMSPFVAPVVIPLLPQIFAAAQSFLGQDISTKIVEVVTSLIVGRNPYASPATAATASVRQPSTRTQTAPTRMASSTSTSACVNAQTQPPSAASPTENPIPDADFLAFMRSDRAGALVASAMNSIFGGDAAPTATLHGPFTVPEGECTGPGTGECSATPASVREARAAAMMTTPKADVDFRVIESKLRGGETVHLHDGTIITPGADGILTINVPGSGPVRIPMRLFLGEDVRHHTERILAMSSRVARDTYPNIAGAIPVPLDTPFENVQNLLATGATVVLGQAPKMVFLCLDSENPGNYLVSALETPGVILSVAASNFDPNASMAAPTPAAVPSSPSEASPTEVAIEAPTIFEDAPATPEKVPDGTVEDDLD